MELNNLAILKVVELVPIKYFKFRVLILFEKNIGFAVLSSCTSNQGDVLLTM